MSNVDQIKSRLDLVDTIGSYIKIEKSGLNFKACCPFHNEKTPSFYISPQKNIWHCFGCQKSGDLIAFVMEIEKMEFLEALNLLAVKAGVELKHENPGSRSEKTRALNILEEAKNFYKKELFKNKPVFEYLTKERGLLEETIKEFEIGFSPDGWRNIYDFLINKGYKASEIEKVGLVILNPKSQTASPSYYDRFRNRVMFPINDQSGRTVAFGGRVFVGNSVSDSKQAAKYINSPQTFLYDKSRILFNFDKAKLEIAKENCSVIVEGYMDAIMSYQAGVKNTVAVSGTALTCEQINLISRLSKKAAVSFDADDAGITATGRSLNLLISSGMEVRIVKIKGEKDPADFIKKEAPGGPENWIKLVKEAEHILEFYLNHLEEKSGGDKRQFILKTAEVLFPYLMLVSGDMEKSFWIKKIAGVAQIQEDAVWKEFEKFRISSLRAAQKSAAKDNYGGSKAEKTIRKEDLEKRISGIIFLLDLKEGLSDEIRKLFLENSHIFSGGFKAALGAFIEKKEPLKDEELIKFKALALELELVYNCEVEEIIKEFSILINELKKEDIRIRREALAAEIKKLELAADKDLALEFLAKVGEFNRLSKELNTL